MEVGQDAGNRRMRRGERGTALIVALLVMVIMTLLGIPFLLMGETENRIAENERLSLQALYAAESGARLVKRWFDKPGNPTNVFNPPLLALNREVRDIDDDGDPLTAAVDADGSPAHPYYKQDDDAVFDRPYRGGQVDTLLGTEDGPDIRIIAAGPDSSVDSRQFLELLSSKLFSNYPSAGSGRSVRISQIDVYAPPYVQVGGVWKRYGVGTVKVVGRIVQRYPDGSEIVLSERTVKIVLNEVRYAPAELGAMNSCGPTEWNDDVSVHWGSFVATHEVDFPGNNWSKLPASLPRVVPPSAQVDLLWAYDDATDWAAYYYDILELHGYEIQDPWFRLLSADHVKDNHGQDGADQPWPFDWLGSSPLDTMHEPYNAYDDSDPIQQANPGSGGPVGVHSNFFQNLGFVSCPEFDYATWKKVAMDGGENIHYYTDAGSGTFKENGEGLAKTVQEHTDGKTGLFFFDTEDGLPPEPDGSNMTDKVELVSGTWGVTGMVYLNARQFIVDGVTGRATTMRAPGEPFRDLNENGQRDPAEPWIDLVYATDLDKDLDGHLDAGLFLAVNEAPGVSTYDMRGPNISANVLVDGLLYTSGVFSSKGSGTYYGAVVAVSGVDELGSGDTPDIYWNEDLRGSWPPGGWGLPRVRVTRWETDL